MNNDQPQPDDSLPELSSDGTELSKRPRPEAAGKERKQIGPYKILQKIAEGGMGAVYMAEQSEPIKRRVALKLIKAGRDTEQIIARFDAERQALAMMDHANIARIFDAGTTDDGSPYFVMELVNGVPLTEYCDRNKLSIRERLELFVPVCKAVQHAHTKGIIHRDLKPSNVLVALYDGVPVPKVIDFGLAKATEHQLSLTDKTMFTEFGQVVGTLQYMSPEQAEMNQLDIDTRTDVYSLGVMLYELLTGSTPLDDQTMKEQALLKVLELIRETEPPRPSTRLSDSGDAISGVSDQRRIDPSRLQKILKGELDWIVMKSLEKDRTRRYETPNAFAQDISNFLNEEAVSARPPSNSYKLQKFIRKNRGLVASVLLTIGLLTFGLIGTSYFMYRALSAEELSNQRLNETEIARKEEQAARELANQRLNETEIARKDEQAARELATEEAKKSKTSETRSSKLFDIVTSAFYSVSPDAGANDDMSAKQVLINAQKGLSDSGLDGQGKTELLSVLTRAFYSLGEYELAIETATEEVALNTELHGEKASETLTGMNNLATIYGSVGREAEAIKIHEKTLRIREEGWGKFDASTLAVRNNLATALYGLGDYKGAAELFEVNHKAIADVHGETHVNTLATASNLGAMYNALGETEKAMRLYKQSAEASEAANGRDATATLTFLTNLAATYQTLGRFDEAEAIFDEVLAGRMKRLGPDHFHTLDAINNLAGLYDNTDRQKEALKLFQQANDGYMKELGLSHPATLGNTYNLAGAYCADGQREKGIELFEKACTEMVKQMGADHPEVQNSINGWAKILVDDEQFEKAIKVLEQHFKDSFAAAEKTWQVFDAMSIMGAALTGNGDLDKAKAKLEAGWKGLSELREKIPAANRLERLSFALDRLIDHASAAKDKKAELKWKTQLKKLKSQEPKMDEKGETLRTQNE